MEEFRRQALLVATRLLRRPEDAEDVAQEAVLRRLAARDHGTAVNNERAFAARIATHLCLDRIRARQQHAGKRATIAQVRTPAAETPALPEDVRRLYDAIAALPARQAAVVTLRKLVELEYEDVAELLGISVANCRSHCRFAMERLRQMLAMEKGAAQTSKG